jgi:Lysozyme like domain
MTALPGWEIVGLARSAGVSEADLPAMVAICFRESGWNPDATHRNTNGTIDLGLWQINRPAFDQSLLDPQTNAQAMGALYGSRGLEPWTFGSHGTATYAPFLARARQAISDPRSRKIAAVIGAEKGVASSVGNSLPDPLAWIAPFVRALEFITNPENWLRLGEVLAGAMLVAGGLLVLFHESKVGQEVESKVATAAPLMAA